jgi:acetoin utilization protein AcuB
MLVRDWMSKDVVTIDEDESMDQAVRILKEKRIKTLPVMKQNKIVGILTDRDLKKASASDATSLDIHELLYLMTKIKVKHIMSKPVITVPDDFTVEETAQVLLENRISGVPVLNPKGEIVGMITQNDLFKVIVSLTGIRKKGLQFAVLVDDRPGSIKEIADIIRAFGGRMLSILTSYEEAPEGKRKVYMRMHSIDREKIEQLKSAIRQKARLVYLVDHRNNIREISDPAAG